MLPNPSDIVAAVYVDNFAIIGTNPVKTEVYLLKVVAHLTNLGLVIHEITPPSVDTVFVGLQFSRSQVFVKRQRLWRLHFAIDTAADRGFASGEMLQVLLGHMTLMMLVRREALSVFGSLYRHAREFGA